MPSLVRISLVVTQLKFTNTNVEAAPLGLGYLLPLPGQQSSNGTIIHHSLKKL